MDARPIQSSIRPSFSGFVIALLLVSGCTNQTAPATLAPAPSAKPAASDPEISLDEAVAAFARALLNPGQFDSRRTYLIAEDALAPVSFLCVCQPQAAFMSQVNQQFKSAGFVVDYEPGPSDGTKPFLREATYARTLTLVSYCAMPGRSGSQGCADNPMGRPTREADIVRDVVYIKLHTRPVLEQCRVTVLSAAARWFEDGQVKRPARQLQGVHRDMLITEVGSLFNSALQEAPTP